MKIVLGKTCDEKSAAGARWRNVSLDLDVLLRTRLLVQANSGGGKSWLLRRLAEQLFGKIPVIIIDPEGEFATLREKYGYVLAGKGGDTPADPRSAALLAHRLLELRASAVCDLYEMKPSERHHWVRLFLEALINAPKNLWRPTIIMVDEAHTFCPEKGSGESEASDAMVSLPTRGRKRRFCPVWATQRLGKLRKDASAELLNRLIGPTFEDVDLKRAADLLSIRSEDRRQFDAQMRVLEPGSFFALGRAITKERLLVRVGEVETSHEIEDAKHGIEAPPPPEKVKALLPKLKDLPQAAEEKARTEAEFRREIRELKQQLVAARKAQPSSSAVSGPGRATACPLPHADPKAIERSVAKLDAQRRQELSARDRAIKQLSASLAAIAGQAAKAAGVKLAEIKPIKIEFPKPNRSPESAQRIHPERVEAQPRGVEGRSNPNVSPHDGIIPRQFAILQALAEFEAIGRGEIPRTWVAARSRSSHRSSAFTNNLGALRSSGLIEYGAGSTVRLTDSGRAAVPEVGAPLSTEEMLESCLRIVTLKQGAILKALHQVHPQSLNREELAERAGASPNSSAYTNNLGGLRSAGMIDYGPNSTVKCADWLFID